MVEILTSFTTLLMTMAVVRDRGGADFVRVITELAKPAIAGQSPAQFAIDAIAGACTAALADPEGDSLSRTLAAIRQKGNHSAAAE